MKLDEKSIVNENRKSNRISFHNTLLLQEQNSDYFSQYVTEEISEYVERKRFLGVHGNHLEIQALSEMYNRPIHIYCYSAEPINIFQVNMQI